MGQSSLSQEENVAKLVGVTSSGSFLVTLVQLSRGSYPELSQISYEATELRFVQARISRPRVSRQTRTSGECFSDHLISTAVLTLHRLLHRHISFTWSFTSLVIPTTSMILDDHAANQTLMCP